MDATNQAHDIGPLKPYILDPGQEPKADLETKKVRWSQLDIARGIAIALMILSHSIKGLVFHKLVPEWGIVPVHLITKFSSSLFILVFGFSLSLYFVPHVGKDSWSSKRNWMLKRGFDLLVWYKILTVFQMFQFYPKGMILDSLMFKATTDFVEILFFYSIALLWVPFMLPLWSRIGLAFKAALIIGFMAIGQWLHYNFDFWHFETLKAVLVENEKFYTFGQLQRGALIFLGLLLGDFYKKTRGNKLSQLFVPLGCLSVGTILLTSFYYMNVGSVSESLLAIAKNIGKHPFDLNFLCFSLGGALIILATSLMLNLKVQKFFKPLSYLGRNSLNAFIIHIIIIFYFFRYLFDLHHEVSYFQGLCLTVACIGLTIATLYIVNRIKEMLK